MANLRDKGYPSAKSEQVNRSNKQNLLMKDDKPITVAKALQTETREIPSKHEEMVDRLVTAYNNRAFANPSAPLLSKIDFKSDDYNEKGMNLMKNGAGDLSGRLAFAKKSQRAGNPVEYDVGVDNGNPNRGVLDLLAKTPLGSFNGGFEDETNYASYSKPNGEYGMEAYYMNDYMSNPLEASAGIGTSDLGGQDIYANVNAPFISADAYKSYDTPLGNVTLGANPATADNNGFAYADYTPNQYIQALINLMNRGR